MSDSLGEALPKEMARVTDMIEVYASLPNGAGALAIILMRHDLDKAAKAMAEGDVVAMMQAYQSLKELKL